MKQNYFVLHVRKCKDHLRINILTTNTIAVFNFSVQSGIYQHEISQQLRIAPFGKALVVEAKVRVNVSGTRGTPGISRGVS